MRRRPTPRLDVLVPTLDRGLLVERAVRSVLRAKQPTDLAVCVTVIANGCVDDTVDRIAALQAEAPGRISIVHERRRGKSRALNAGFAATHGDLVGMIDDDEEVDSQWLVQIAAAFADPAVEFIGGPYVPVWNVPAPEWVPDDYLAVVGAADSGPERREYGPDFPGILKGGNAVIRRETLYRAGPYAVHLGPGRFSRLFSCEDEEMYHRLLKNGARGRYVPSLIVYHHVMASRVTPEYFRSWCFWRGVSRGLMDRMHPLPVRYFAGVPRFLYGRALEGLIHLGSRSSRRDSASRLADELRVWDLAGYWYGRNVYTLARFLPVHNRRHAPIAWPAPTPAEVAPAPSLSTQHPHAEARVRVLGAER
jgi:glucosyl-dolichyl phosphate glucuronosyltransferase